MRHTTLLLLLAVISPVLTRAQNFYFKAGAGYAFAMPGQTRNGAGASLNGTITDNSLSQSPGLLTSSWQGVIYQQAYSFDIKPASFSAGLQGIVAGGYMFGKHIGVELNAAVNVAPRKYTITRINTTISSNIPGDYSITQQARKMILLTPSLVLKTGGSDWNIYGRIGLALPFNTGIKRRELLRAYTGQTQEDTWHNKNYFAIGYAAATGVSYDIGDNFSLWLEVSVLHLAIPIKESEFVSETINGSVYISPQTSATKHFYSKKGNINYTNTELTYDQPYSNIGLSLGVSYAFGNPAAKQVKTP